MKTTLIAPLTVSLWLTACGSPAADDAANASPSPTQAAPTAAEAAAIMRAAGYVQRGGKWMGSCADPGDRAAEPDAWYDVEIDSYGDLNEDGQPEALIAEGGSSYCFGMTGYGFTLLSQTASGWSPLLQGEQGMPSLYDRPGQAWPDIEIGGPGSDCFSFLRWNGVEYAYAGRSLEGRICEMDPEFTQASSAPVGTSQGRLAFPPIPEGYYAYGGVSCREAAASGDAENPPANLVVFDRTGMFEFDGGPQIEGFDDLGGGRYRVHARYFGNGGLDSDTGEADTFTLRVTGPSSFIVDYDGTGESVAHIHCPTNSVPRAVRENWLEFNG